MEQIVKQGMDEQTRKILRQIREQLQIDQVLSPPAREGERGAQDTEEEPGDWAGAQEGDSVLHRIQVAGHMLSSRLLSNLKNLCCINSVKAAGVCEPSQLLRAL